MWSITLFRIKEIRSYSGIRTIGKLYVQAAIIEKLQKKIQVSQDFLRGRGSLLHSLEPKDRVSGAVFMCASFGNFGVKILLIKSIT